MNVEIDTMCQQHILMKQLTAAEDTTLLKITPKSKEDTTSNLQEETPLTSSQLQRKSPETLDAPSVWFSKRFFILILLFFGHIMMAVVGQVTNIAIIEMVSKNSHSTNDSNNFISQDVQPPRYQWNSMTVSLVLNMFAYGSLFIPLGGIISQKFGGSTTLGVTMMLSGVALIFSPYSLYVNFYVFLALRGLLGFFQGFSIASCATIFANWIPKPERSTCVSLVMNGFYIGNGLTFISCGYLMHRWGWSMAFYSTGTLCFIWSLLWLIFVPNDPADDKRISRRELLYIKKETGNVSPSNTGNPYKAILLTSSFWALTLCNFAYGWTNAFTVGYSPSFIKDAVQMDVNLVGYISSIPNLANIFTIPLAGILMSHWQKKSKLRDSQIHKIILCVGFLISSTLFTLIVIANNFVLSMICLVLINGMISYSRILCEYHTFIQLGLKRVRHHHIRTLLKK
ncbi:vesicular glutamate transporter 3-like isoform X2 [Planococcus citri]|uniref:vesicular glutamate transporter 3-like isoform X2 n=1 Tax=Planococcus citri TaxID=170843 RepID=UPI0031F78B58